jgi:hypothetical protein
MYTMPDAGEMHTDGPICGNGATIVG